jgi:hypothetical protein
MATTGRRTKADENDLRYGGHVKKKRRRIAFVPRVAVGTAMFAIVPACVASACSSDDSGDGAADAHSFPTSDMYFASDTRYVQDSAIAAEADVHDDVATDAPLASDGPEGGEEVDAPDDANETDDAASDATPDDAG